MMIQCIHVNLQDCFHISLDSSLNYIYILYLPPQTFFSLQILRRFLKLIGVILPRDLSIKF